MGKLGSKKFNPDVDIKGYYDNKQAFQDRYEYLMSIGMTDLAEFSRLRSSLYAIMTLILMKLNYLQYRNDIKKFMGCTPSQLIIKLIRSGNPDLMKRAIKLALVWFKSIFNPYVKYVPLNQKENDS